MAKIKNTENTENPVTPEVAVESPVENPVERNTKEVKVEPDERVKAILKNFAGLEMAYVDSRGGVFGMKTEKHLLGDAVLYKNPYYKLK